MALAFRQCAHCYSFVLNKVNAKKKIGFVHGEVSYMGDISSWKKYMLKFDKIAYVSQAVKNQFITVYPQLKNNACTVYNTFDFERINQLSTQPNPISFDANKKNIVTVARISQEKRIDWIPIACKNLKDRIGNVFHWYVLGGGPNFEIVQKKIIELDVADVLTMVGSVANPFAILKDADFSVLLSKTEAYPMVVIEAFALKIPLVVTQFPSIFEMMQNEKQGLIVESNFNSLVDGVEKFIKDTTLLKNCKQNLLEQEFSNEKAYEQLMEAIS